MDHIRATGRVSSFTPVQINERYARVLATARELLDSQWRKDVGPTRSIRLAKMLETGKA